MNLVNNTDRFRTVKIYTVGSLSNRYGGESSVNKVLHRPFIHFINLKILIFIVIRIEQLFTKKKNQFISLGRHQSLMKFHIMKDRWNLLFFSDSNPKLKTMWKKSQSTRITHEYLMFMNFKKILISRKCFKRKFSISI